MAFIKKSWYKKIYKRILFFLPKKQGQPSDKFYGRRYFILPELSEAFFSSAISGIEDCIAQSSIPLIIIS